MYTIKYLAPELFPWDNELAKSSKMLFSSTFHGSSDILKQ